MFKRDKFGFIIIAAIALISVLQTSQIFTTAFTKVTAKRFHFKLPFAEYCLVQVIPVMYNYKNYYEYTTSDGHTGNGYINHHPMRLFIDPESRKLLHYPVTVKITTSFNTFAFTSIWVLTKNGLREKQVDVIQ